MHPSLTVPTVAIVGAGPAGLMAAEVISAGGVQVDVYDAMPSAGRKFLLAGVGGLNLTHGETRERFVARYADRAEPVSRWLEALDADAVRAWAAGLGVETFVGSSGRVFPVDMKAAPLLRAWLTRLRAAGVRLHARHRWVGGAGAADAPSLRFDTPGGPLDVAADAVVLATGGASWPRLGSDGAWWPLLADRGVALARLRPANCGFDVHHEGAATAGWTDHLRERHAGQPLKTIALHVVDPATGALRFERRGECIVTATGLEGSLIYAASALLRDLIERDGAAHLVLDLLPDHSAEAVGAEMARPRGPRSLGTHLRSRFGLTAVKSALLHECLAASQRGDPAAVAHALKALPVRLTAPRPVAEAISTAGGVRFDAMDEHSMLKAWPGVYCAGEMIDWEAPTGGYLLTACLSSGAAAGRGVLRWLDPRRGPA